MLSDSHRSYTFVFTSVVTQRPNKTPSAPDNFQVVGWGSVIQLINESDKPVAQSYVSPRCTSGLPEVRMS